MATYINQEKARAEIYKLTGIALCTPLCAISLDYILHGANTIRDDFVIRSILLAITFFYVGQLSFNRSVNIMYNLDRSLSKNEN